MSNYDKQTAERMVLNLYRHGDMEAAYDAIFDNPELEAELLAEDLTACQMLDRILGRNGPYSVQEHEQGLAIYHADVPDCPVQVYTKTPRRAVEAIAAQYNRRHWGV